MNKLLHTSSSPHVRDQTDTTRIMIDVIIALMPATLYGIYQFKRGFNGYVEELFGAYETGTNLTYRIYSLLKSIKNIGK